MKKFRVNNKLNVVGEHINFATEKNTLIMKAKDYKFAKNYLRFLLKKFIYKQFAEHGYGQNEEDDIIFEVRADKNDKLKYNVMLR